MPDEEGRNKEPSHTDTEFLDAVPDGQRILTKARAGTKAGVKGHLENPMTPPEAREWVRQGGNVGIKLGGIDSDDWTPFVLDVEESGDLPDQATDVVEWCTLAIFESPHGGRNRLIRVTDDAYHRLDSVSTKIDLDNDGEHEVELLTSGHAIAPPSKVNHSDCRDGKAGCPGDGTGKYELVKWNPDAEVMTKADAEELLNALDITPTPQAGQTAGSEDSDWDIPDPDPARADEGEVVLRTLQKENAKAFSALIDLLCGRIGRWGEDLTNEGEIDRSEQELLALTLLYQSAVELADMEAAQAREVTKATFEEYVSNNPYTEDGQLRKWITDREAYQNNRCRKAFSRSQEFEMFLNVTAGDSPDNVTGQPGADGYSDVTRAVVLFAVDYLSGSLDLYVNDAPVEDLQELARTYGLYIDVESVKTLLSLYPHSSVLGTDPPSGDVPPTDYPTSDAICEVARAVDTQSGEPRSEDTYKTARSNLQQEGLLKQAYCPSRSNGERYVYYPSYEPDPDDARYVKTENEKRQVEEQSTTESASTLVTDGGIDFKTPSVPWGYERGQDERTGSKRPRTSPEGCEQVSSRRATRTRPRRRTTGSAEGHQRQRIHRRRLDDYRWPPPDRCTIRGRSRYS